MVCGIFSYRYCVKGIVFFGDEHVDSFETAYFIDKIDKFFDTLNVSSFNKGKHKRKLFCEPFRSPNDFRMKVTILLI